jgi:hypothetical protein
MNGPELDLLESGERGGAPIAGGSCRVVLASMCENPLRWASHSLTGAADYVSTLAIYARYPIRLEDAGTGRGGSPRYQRRYLLDGHIRRTIWRFSRG